MTDRAARTDVNIEDAEAIVIARAVGRIVDAGFAGVDIIREHVVDGLVALVSEGWQLIPPGAEPDAMCENVGSVGGARFSCDHRLGHDGRHGGIYPGDAGDVEVRWGRA